MKTFYGPVASNGLVHHNLDTTDIVTATVWRNDKLGKELVMAGVRVINADTVQVDFAHPPTMGVYHVGIVAA